MKHLITFGLLSLALFAQAHTPDETQGFSDEPTRLPQADAGDVPTLGQTETSKQNADKSRPDKCRAGGIRDSYIYKTVGKQELELYVDSPKGHTSDANAPAIVLFHGGGFRTGSVNQFRQQAKHLADRGMVCFRVRYRLTREKSVEVIDCIEDAISAMRWVRVNADKLGIDPDRIAAGGGSAGGYLSAATLLVDFINADTDPPNVSAQPNALVLFNPGFGSGKGEDPGPDPRDPEGKGDLRKYVKPNMPPMINFFGTEDPLLADAKRFQETYKNAGNRFELITYEGQGHSFFNKEKYREPTLAEADKFLVELGWLKKPE